MKAKRKAKKAVRNLNVRMPPELIERLKLLAQQKQRSLNGQVVFLLGMTVGLPQLCLNPAQAEKQTETRR